MIVIRPSQDLTATARSDDQLQLAAGTEYVASEQMVQDIQKYTSPPSEI